MILDATTPTEALGLRPDRLAVIAKGHVIAERARNDARLSLPGRPHRCADAILAKPASLGTTIAL